MGRLVTFDLDSLISKMKILSDEAPALLSVAEASGITGAGKLAAYAPMAAPIAAILSKLAGGDSISAPGMPDTGPRGRGRLSYLRNKSRFNNKEVVLACESITLAGLTQSKTIADTVNYTLACMYPGVPASSWDDAQTRSAIDQILEADGLSEGLCDKLGDMIYYHLTTQTAIKAKEG